jgi:hypothetical protein
MATTEQPSEDELRNLWKISVHTARRRVLLAGLLAAAAVAAIPTSASAVTENCAGHWGYASKDALTDLTTDFGATYTFSCSRNVHAFTVITTRQVSAFSVQAAETIPATGATGLLFSCEGAQPGFGTTCTGANATDKALAGDPISGSVGMEVGPAAWDADSGVPFAAWVVATDNTGTLAGPYLLKPPKGYAKKYAKAVKKAKAKKSAHRR